MKPVYLNTDLVVRARLDFSGLHREFEQSGIAFGGDIEIHNHVGRSVYQCSLPHKTPAEAIANMLDHIDKLSPESRRQWDACLCRRFDIGFALANEEFGWSHGAWQLHPQLLRRIADAGASVVTTVYANPY